MAVFDSFGRGAYLSILIRQPIHRGPPATQTGTELPVDVRNPLAEDYRPFLMRDGSTVYFAQDERPIQGRLSFSLEFPGILHRCVLSAEDR
jgi:hypothetical protein